MFGKPWYWPWLSRTLSSLHLHQPTSVIYQIIITYLLHGNTLINYCLIPFRIKTFLDIFSSPLVLSTELEEKKKRCFFFNLHFTLSDAFWSNQRACNICQIFGLTSLYNHCILKLNFKLNRQWHLENILGVLILLALLSMSMFVKKFL